MTLIFSFRLFLDITRLRFIFLTEEVFHAPLKDVLRFGEQFVHFHVRLWVRDGELFLVFLVAPLEMLGQEVDAVRAVVAELEGALVGKLP